MATGLTTHLRVKDRRVISLIFGAALTGVSVFAYGQQPAGATNKTTANVADVIAKASEDTPDSSFYVEKAVQMNAVEATPVLEQKFARAQDGLDKVQVASALVRLGDKNDTYWNYLAEKANSALQDDAPSFMSYDAQGKSKPGPSPEFVEWANAHHKPLQSASENAMIILPGEIGILAKTGDKRAIPILREALLSRNSMVQIMAALGLAKIQDKESIPLIIEACRHASAESADAIAASLIYFDDPDAQSAVDTYITKDRAKVLREARAKGEKPLG